MSAALKTRAVRVTTRCLCFVLVAIGLATVPRISRADAPPSAADIDAAKKDFVEGKALHDQGKLDAAIAKFKDSYRLSKNPTLLYNIAFTLDEAGQKEAALFYYKKFLTDAPADAGQRATASDRVKALDTELGNTSSGSGSGSGPITTTPEATKPATTDTAIKPIGTYAAKDFAHAVVDDAPPGKPLDVTATVPQDSGFVVTLYFRSAGDAAFTAKVMRWRNKELVARIPAAKMTGSSIQYYIEARDKANTLVARSGKATEPNLINLDATIAAKNYPDFVDDQPVAANGKPTGKPVDKHHDEEDPLHKHDAVQQPPNTVVATATDDATGTGAFDVGSTKFRAVKWTATGVTVALLATSVIFYIQAGDANNTLQQEAKLSTTTPGCTAAPPCRAFDSYLANAQSEGKRDQLISRVTLGVGVAAAVVGGYYWYRQVFGKPATESPTQQSARARHRHDGPSWVLAPAFGDGFTGAAAGATF